MNFPAIEQAIFDWVSYVHAGPVTVIWDDPAAPQPRMPFIRLSFVQGPTRLGHDALYPDESSQDAFELRGQRQMMLSAIAYGQESIRLISELGTSVYNPNAMEILYAAGLTIIDTSPNRDVTVAVETQYEKRAQMDFTMLCAESVVIEPGSVNQVRINSEVNGVEETIIADNGGE